MQLHARKQKNMLSYNYTNKPSINIKTLGLEKYIFYYGIWMQKVQVESNSIFLDWVASKYGQSTRALVIAGELVVTEVNKDLILKFDTANDETNHLETLKYQKKALCKQTLEDYVK